MTDPFSQIRNKYQKYFFDLSAYPKKGQKVVYFPGHNGFTYIYYEKAFSLHNFAPADVMTIRLVKQATPCNHVYVDENKYTFSPAELVPVEYVEEKDIRVVREYFEKYCSKHPL